MSEVPRSAGMPGSPALALSHEEADAIALALKRLRKSKPGDRTIGLAAIYKALHDPAARVRMLSDVAIKAIKASAKGGGGGPHEPL